MTVPFRVRGQGSTGAWLFLSHFLMTEDSWQVNWHRVVNGQKTDIGQVYLGQSLHLVLTISNSIGSCQIHVELQTGSQRCTLLDQSTDPDEKECISCTKMEYELGWEVKEAGVHVLACSITSQEGTSRSFHKFSATSPFQLRTRSSLVKLGTDDVILVAAQLTNVTCATFRIESISLVGEDELESSGQEFEFKPRNSYQYVFRVKPTGTLGRLDIRWRTADGDTGHLQTAPLAHNPPADKEPISLESISSGELKVNEPGEIELRLTNNTQRPLVDVFIGIAKSGILPIGESFVQVGVLEPNKIQSLILPIIPLRQGAIDVDNMVLGFTDEWVKQRLTKTISLYIV